MSERLQGVLSLFDKRVPSMIEFENNDLFPYQGLMKVFHGTQAIDSKIYSKISLSHKQKEYLQKRRRYVLEKSNVSVPHREFIERIKSG
jgi:hypothetical protein